MRRLFAVIFGLALGVLVSVSVIRVAPRARFQSYPGVGHVFVPAMRAAAIAWFLGSS